MDEDPNQAPDSDSNKVDSERRKFLRNSVYAAYATPLITALLVEEASAAPSPGRGWNKDGFCDDNQDHPKCR